MNRTPAEIMESRRRLKTEYRELFDAAAALLEPRTGLGEYLQKPEHSGYLRPMKVD